MKTKQRKSQMTVLEAAMSVSFLWANARSKDPSTKVGACVVDPRTGGLFLGYNGFPVGIEDNEEIWNRRQDLENRVTDECKACGGTGKVWEDTGHGSGLTEPCEKCTRGRVPSPSAYRLRKYDLVVHAENNAVRKALMAGVDLSKAVLVCTMIPCPACMLTEVVAQGIREVVFSEDHYHAQTARDAWVTRELARLGHVHLVHVNNAGKMSDV